MASDIAAGWRSGVVILALLADLVDKQLGRRAQTSLAAWLFQVNDLLCTEALTM